MPCGCGCCYPCRLEVGSRFSGEFHCLDELFRLDENDDQSLEKRLPDETIPAANAVLTTTPANGVTQSSSIRQRVKSKPSEGECSHGHAHHHHHHHPHHT